MRKLFQLVAGIILLNAPCSLRAETADDFLKAYFLIQDGDAAEKSGEAAKAADKYNAALKILRVIKKETPDWNPNIIAYRSKYCVDHIAKDGGTVVAEDAASSSASGGAATAPDGQASTPVNTIPTGAVPAAMPAEVSPGASGTPAERIASLESELNQARTDLKALQTEKAALEARLQKAEETLKANVGNGSGGGEERIQELLKENATLKMALDAAKKEAEDLRAANDSLRKELEDTRVQLKTASTGPASSIAPEVLQTLQKENALLRSIVDRQFQEDAKRTAARDVISKELQELGARSESVRSQLAILQSPLSPLTAEEREMLKTPGASIRPATDDPTKLTGVVSSNRGQGAASGGEAGKLTGDNAILASDAKRLFNKGDMEGAAAKYEQILQNDPKNLFALSNLGVVRFRQDKMDDAEKALKSSLSLDSQDAFSLSVLGIVHYRQGKYDDAVKDLTRAISISGDNPETHNYLGITYSQKGYQEAAEKELLKAIELKPDYADAHFNLAVVFASQTPPSVEMARKHYKKARELGVSKDPELEKLLNK